MIDMIDMIGERGEIGEMGDRRGRRSRIDGIDRMLPSFFSPALPFPAIFPPSSKVTFQVHHPASECQGAIRFSSGFPIVR